jgi:hypothetical protein
MLFSFQPADRKRSFEGAAVGGVLAALHHFSRRKARRRRRLKGRLLLK